MERSRRFKALWSLWMAGGGIAVGVLVYLATASIWWTIIGLLLASVVLNAIGRVATQPIAVGPVEAPEVPTRHRHRADIRRQPTPRCRRVAADHAGTAKGRG